MIGWIKIHRKIQDHWVWQKPEYFKWWMDILLEANFVEKEVVIKNQILVCNRGEILYSLDTWAKRWNVNKSKVRRFLEMLEKCNMIVTKNETVTTRITICKYDTYQDERNADETQMKRKRNANETEMTPTKEGKKDKNEKNINKGHSEKNLIELHNQVFNELWNSEIWITQTAMKYKTDIPTLKEKIKEFHQECTLKEEYKQTSKDAKTHFINWANLKNIFVQKSDEQIFPYGKSNIKDNWW